MTRRQLAPLFVCAALALPGCGGGTGEVSGVVKYRGEPLPGGTIPLYDATRGVWSSEIKPDGSYTVRTVPPGKARITVITPAAISMPGMPPPKTIPIRAKYNDAAQSGLTYQVRVGRQTHDVDLD
jgi:hypothetical protein